MSPNESCLFGGAFLLWPRAAVTRQEIQAAETEELIDRMFDGSKAEFFAAFLSGQDLSGKELDELKQMLISMEQEEG